MSIIKGISSEKPADVRVRWMERIWSVYDVNGESIKLRAQVYQFYFVIRRILETDLVQYGSEETEQGRDERHLKQWMGNEASVEMSQSW